jgi:hypothetical protein
MSKGATPEEVQQLNHENGSEEGKKVYQVLPAVQRGECIATDDPRLKEK